MRIGSLFSGIGGLELGAEAALAGETIWQVEIDPFCRDVLARYWPKAKRYEDVRAVGASVLEPVDCVVGGFPCQDVSSAGKGAGLSGARSGLWYEYKRIVEELRPPLVVVENVSSGKRRWLPFVRRDLCDLGYRTVAVEIGACDVGAPHRRLRVFVVAVADAYVDALEHARAEHGEVAGTCGAGETSADPLLLLLRQQSRRRGGTHGQGAAEPRDVGEARPAADADGARHTRPVSGVTTRIRGLAERPWSDDAMPEPALRRVDDGLPARVVRSRQRRRNRRLKALGNAVVPECARSAIVYGLELLAEVA